MTVYSYSQLEGLWIANGGSQATAPIAAAIAMAESSGNSDATSANPDGGTNVGLWQLDTPGGKGAGYTVAQLENPATNAAVAVQGSSGGSDWSAWATYASGAYEKFLQSGTAPTSTSTTSSSGSSTNVVTGLWGDVTGLIGGLVKGTGAAYDALRVPAYALAWLYEALQPSQEMRLVMAGGGVVSGAIAVHLFTGSAAGIGPVGVGESQPADEGSGAFAAAIAFAGIAVLLFYTAFRPWPSSGGKPLRPAAYFADILQGYPPAAGTAPDLSAEATDVQKGLAAILVTWAAAKLLRALAAGGQGFMDLLPGDEGGEGEGGEGGEGGEAPPVDELPPVDVL